MVDADCNLMAKLVCSTRIQLASLGFLTTWWLHSRETDRQADVDRHIDRERNSRDRKNKNLYCFYNIEQNKNIGLLLFMFFTRGVCVL